MGVVVSHHDLAAIGQWWTTCVESFPPRMRRRTTIPSCRGTLHGYYLDGPTMNYRCRRRSWQQQPAINSPACLQLSAASAAERRVSPDDGTNVVGNDHGVFPVHHP
eukprot:scaffold168042_cov48-Attheya_sp.AAC.1